MLQPECLGIHSVHWYRDQYTMELWTVTLSSTSDTFTYHLELFIPTGKVAEVDPFQHMVCSQSHSKKPVFSPMFTDTSHVWYVIISRWLPVLPEHWSKCFAFLKVPPPHTHTLSPTQRRNIWCWYAWHDHILLPLVSGNVLTLENYKNVQCEGVCDPCCCFIHVSSPTSWSSLYLATICINHEISGILYGIHRSQSYISKFVTLR